MNRIRADDRRLRLDSDLYEKLRQQVLRRDRWRCQSCGALANLEVHHLQFRSQQGDDSEQNLITLCVQCHARMHTRECCFLESGECHDSRRNVSDGRYWLL